MDATMIFIVLSPLCVGPPRAWVRLFVGVCEAVIYHYPLENALGNTPPSLRQACGCSAGDRRALRLLAEALRQMVEATPRK